MVGHDAIPMLAFGGDSSSSDKGGGSSIRRGLTRYHRLPDDMTSDEPHHHRDHQQEQPAAQEQEGPATHSSSAVFRYDDSPEPPQAEFTGRGADAFLPSSPGHSTTDGGSRLQSPFTPSTPAFRSTYNSGNPLIQPTRVQARASRFLQPSKTSIQAARPPSFWDTVLRSKWSMVICLAIGLLGAIAHHMLYWHLDGRPATNQQWWLRLGQFISFCSKAGFALALLMAHSQAAWREVGRRSYSVGAVDSLFGAAHDITELFNKEAWQKSWLVMFLAIYIWASPLVVIFSSATLNVISDTKREQTMCPNIRTLNFSHEETNDYRYINIPEGQDLRSLSFSIWNTTSTNVNDTDHFDYWTKPSDQFASIATKVLYGKSAIARENVAVEVCGSGWNCSTTINFVGPGYQCTELTPKGQDWIKPLNGVEAPFNLSKIAPYGNWTYLAVTNEGEYSSQQIDTGEAGIPIQDPPYPQHLGAFRTEPVIWLGYASVENLTEKHPDAYGSKGYRDAYKSIVFACEHYETNYTVNLNYTGGLQTYEVVKRDYMRKIINTTYVRGQDADDGTWDQTIGYPESNYVYPTDVAKYRLTAAYHSMGKQVRDLINGDIKIPGTITESKVIPSRLIDRHEWLPVHNLQEEVRNLYEDIIMSLFSDPQMIAVSWAHDPSKRSGVTGGGAETNYPCMRQQVGNFFFYQWQVLMTVYTVTFVIASVGVVSGFLSMHMDGLHEQRDMSFSSIAEATNGVKLFRAVDKDTNVRYSGLNGIAGERVYRFDREDGRYQTNSGAG